MNTLRILALLLLGTGKLCAADGFVVGQACPDFEIRNMDYYTHKTFRPRQVRGKWLLLDFFTMGCSGSFSALAKLDSLQRQLPRQLQVVLIGKNLAHDHFPASQLKTYYDQYQQKYQYRMAAGYNATLFTRFDIQLTPYAVLVDPTGQVRAVFVPNRTTLPELTDFIQGKRNVLPGGVQELNDQLASQLDWREPLLLHNNGAPEDSFIARSIFTKALPVYTPNPVAVSSMYGNRIQFINKTLDEFFYFAYGDTTSPYPNSMPNSYGKVYPVRGWDWTLTRADSTAYLETEYCYSLTLPANRATTAVLQEALRDDLKRCFGLVARVETRPMPCYVLVNKGDPKRFATRGSKFPINGDYQMGILQLRDVPMQALIKQLWGRYRTKEPVIDETGITGQLDIDLNALFYDPLPEVIKALQAIELDLVKTTRPIKMVVIAQVESGSSAAR